MTITSWQKLRLRLRLRFLGCGPFAKTPQSVTLHFAFPHVINKSVWWSVIRLEEEENPETKPQKISWNNEESSDNTDFADDLWHSAIGSRYQWTHVSFNFLGFVFSPPATRTWTFTEIYSQFWLQWLRLLCLYFTPVSVRFFHCSCGVRTEESHFSNGLFVWLQGFYCRPHGRYRASSGSWTCRAKDLTVVGPEDRKFPVPQNLNRFVG